MRPIHSLLIANRGEIASRIQRTTRALGIVSVAVYSDADAGAPFVRSADRALRIGPAESRQSYLDIERLLDAARRSGADAVHPGFGFLAENADFAQAVLDAGLLWVGPPPSAIAAMGSKREAKRIAVAADVPVIAGGTALDQSTAALIEEARGVGLPVLIKASAGGGGKGMRIVKTEAELEAAIDGARREAKSAFGDDTLLVEKYVERPRHVEIQILGDRHGQLVHLFERECSIQRRHQKIVEEAPSPALSPELRGAMGAAAVRVGRAVGYENAGTVEFILAPDGDFYFLEVNTRLQVEHPVTESIVGLDLVKEQLRIAEGAPLAFRQEQLAIRGAAIEVRLYAEDADKDFLPTTGTIAAYREPSIPGVRVDSGIEAGFEVGIHYDPMLAKIIAHADSRVEAARLLHYALGELVVAGVTTNRELLRRILLHPAFLAGDTHTHFLDEHLAGPAAETAHAPEWAAIAATVADVESRRRQRRVLPALAPGFSNNRTSPERAEFALGSERVEVEYRPRAGGLEISAGGVASVVSNVTLSDDETTVSFEDASGVRRRAFVARREPMTYVQLDGRAFALESLPRFPSAVAEVEPGACVAPMPGKVVRVLAEPGAEVDAGQTLVILEAMKMEHSVKALTAGFVHRVLVLEGEQVQAEAVLAVVSVERPDG
ncbi:MAG: ATP-grasp domain-containing protein [Polyangiaceae bacterium]|nr:ATP-grasp domain-containing protein [Polyangiaceae bacterium]